MYFFSAQCNKNNTTLSADLALGTYVWVRYLPDECVHAQHSFFPDKHKQTLLNIEWHDYILLSLKDIDSYNCTLGFFLSKPGANPTTF
jgi:hypothetical protein